MHSAAIPLVNEVHYNGVRDEIEFSVSRVLSLKCRPKSAYEEGVCREGRHSCCMSTIVLPS